MGPCSSRGRDRPRDATIGLVGGGVYWFAPQRLLLDRVYLTDRPVSDDWFVWDDGEIVDLGGLKGNVGSSNYRIPSDADLSRFETAVVWCRRFTVGFGVAPLDPTR